MHEIIPFIFESKTIRVSDASGEPWFVLRDLLAAIGTSTPTTKAVSAIEQGLCEGFTNVLPLQTQGGTQQIAIVSESAATFLISRSNTDNGRKLNRFIHTEVLPQICKTGRYSPAIPQTYAEALQLAADQARQLEAAKPAVEFHARVADTSDAHTIDETAKLLRCGPRKLRQWMRDNKIMRIDNTPYQEYMNRGYFRVIERTIDIGGAYKLHAQTYCTGKGLQWLQRKIDHHLMGQDVYTMSYTETCPSVTLETITPNRAQELLACNTENFRKTVGPAKEKIPDRIFGPGDME